VFSLADIANNLSTLELLENKRCYYSPILQEEVDNSILLRENDKAKQLIEEYIFFGAEVFFKEVLSYNNVELGKWMLNKYDIPVENFLQTAIYKKNKTWFFESCMQNKKYKKALQDYKDNEGNSLLHNAIYREDVGLIKMLLSQGFNVNITNKKNYTPYYLISESNFKEKDELLATLESLGVNSNLDNQTINNAFVDALKEDDFEKVHKYLKLGADPNQDIAMRYSSWNSNVDTLPAIYHSIISNKEAIAELLLIYGADPNAQSEKYGSPLNLAMKSYKKNIVRMLVYKGADVNYVPETDNNSCEQPLPLIDRFKLNGYDKNGNPVFSSSRRNVMTKADSMLFTAVEKDDLNEIEALFKTIEENGDYYHPRMLEDTLWSSGSLRMIQYFMKERSSDFTQDTLEIIRKSVYKRRADVLESLSPDFFDHIDLSDTYSTDPFITALNLTKRDNSFSTIYSLLSPSKKNTPDTSLTTRDLSLKMVKFLGSRIKKPNSKRYINYCIEGRLYEHFSYFLQEQDLKEDEIQAFLNIIYHKNSKLLAQLNNGLLPDLHIHHFSLLACAAWANNAEAVKMLLDKGADVSFYNNDEKFFYKTHLKPAMWAVLLGNEEIINSLIDKGADFSYLGIPDENIYYASAYTLLMFEKEKWPILKNLLDKKVIHYSTGNNAITLLTQAIYMDSPELVELLLNYPPEENYYLNFKKSYYYAPTNLEECIVYAIKESSEKTFFYLVSKAGKDKFQYEEYFLTRCNSIQIIKWLIENNYGFDGEEPFLKILNVALENNDKELFYSALRNKDQSYVKQVFSGYKVKDLMEIIYENELLDILKYMLDNFIEYDKKYLQKALTEGKKDFIRYFIVDKNVEWLDYYGYNHSIVFDQCKDYDTWKYTLELIIENEGLN
jgi:ankyrin repeat protein